MTRAAVGISVPNLASFRDQWLREGRTTITAGEMRDHISDMCCSLRVPFDELPEPLTELYTMLRAFELLEEVDMSHLVIAANESIEEATRPE